MISARAFGRAILATLVMTSACSASSSAPAAGAYRLEPTGFAALGGWAEDDHEAAFAAFRRGCQALGRGQPALRSAADPDPALVAVCRAGLELQPAPDRQAARAFFERHFTPHHVRPPTGEGFLTGYYEPELDGSLTPDATFRTPLLARPRDLVTAPQGTTLPGLPAGLQAARRMSDGFAPYPDRAAIEGGAIADLAEPLVYLREPGEAFIVHVQGSARIRLRDGAVMRLAYAGRNGHPYTSIGRLLIEQGAIEPGAMSLETLLAWLKAHPDRARALMQRNRSYIFFRVAEDLAPEDGPIGGAGVPLTAGRSLAVDRALWSYGLPFWLDGVLPRPEGGTEPLRRLMIAQDTGSAIVGPARGDVFMGMGAEAGTRAGLLRHPARFIVLRPNPPP